MTKTLKASKRYFTSFAKTRLILKHCAFIKSNFFRNKFCKRAFFCCSKLPVLSISLSLSLSHSLFLSLSLSFSLSLSLFTSKLATFLHTNRKRSSGVTFVGQSDKRPPACMPADINTTIAASAADNDDDDDDDNDDDDSPTFVQTQFAPGDTLSVACLRRWRESLWDLYR